MILNPLPPQAYTKETLVEAYSWIQTQPQHIKEMATSPEMLVSLFMKSKIQGKDCFDRPSIQNFKKELKNLAGIVGEFSEASAMQSPAQFSGINQPITSSPNSNQNSNLHYQLNGQLTSPQASPRSANQSAIVSANSNVAVGGTQWQSQPQTQPQSSPVHSSTALSTAPAEQMNSLLNKNELSTLDTKSKAIIHEVKLAFNLSSDQEALRMLLSIGYHKAMQLVPSQNKNSSN